jgi:hypothetical protein
MNDNNSNNYLEKRNNAAIRFFPFVSPTSFFFFYLITKEFLRMARPSRKMFRSNVQKYDQQAKKLWTRDGRLVQRPPAYQLFVFNFLLILITK